MKDLLLKYGYTEGCRKCLLIRTGDQSQPSLGHSQECRRRIEARMKNDPEQAERLRQAEMRQDEFLAGKVAAGDIDAAGQTERQREVPPAAAQPPGAAPSKQQEAADETLTDFPLPSTTDEDEPELSEPEYKRQRIASASGTEDLDPEEPQEVGALLENQSKRSNKKSAFLPSGSQQKSHGFWREPLLAASTQAIPHVRRPGKFDICEVYSQPRVTSYAAEGSLRPGWSLDICGKDGITCQRSGCDQILGGTHRGTGPSARRGCRVRLESSPRDLFDLVAERMQGEKHCLRIEQEEKETKMQSGYLVGSETSQRSGCKQIWGHSQSCRTDSLERLPSAAGTVPDRLV